MPLVSRHLATRSVAVVMSFSFVIRMIMIVGTVVTGVIMIMARRISSVGVLVLVLMGVIVAMGMGMLVAVRFSTMSMPMGMSMGVLMGVHMFMFVVALHFLVLLSPGSFSQICLPHF